MPEKLRVEAEAYLGGRLNPDIFDEGLDAAQRPLAVATVRLQREHVLSAAAVVLQGKGEVILDGLADLVNPAAFKQILRRYHEKNAGRPNAYAAGVARTLIQIAKHVSTSEHQLTELKRLASKLPPVPFDLAEKNRRLLSQLESERLRARLLFLPERLLKDVAAKLKSGAFSLVDAQVAVAVDIVLAAPVRPQNLAPLTWSGHFQEPNGPNGNLLLHIPAGETKTRRRELVFEIPPDVANRLRWYRRQILAKVADPRGFLFVTGEGKQKSQETLTEQIVERIEIHVGIHMTPHQFRHFAAVSYLEHRPDDFETARQFLGHSSSKTTLIYAGSSSRRASRAYGSFVASERENLQLLRQRSKRKR